MVSVDLEAAQRRARRAYEVAALRRAGLGSVPMLVVGAVAVALARDARPTALLAGFVVVVSFASFWFRRGAQTSAALGFFAGLVPFAASLAGSHLGGHVCSGGGCVSLCLPACTGGGLVAAVIVGGGAARRRAGPGFWVTATAVTIATGALGCSCAGFVGASGMLVGFVLAVVPAALIARRSSRKT